LYVWFLNEGRSYVPTRNVYGVMRKTRVPFRSLSLGDNYTIYVIIEFSLTSESRAKVIIIINSWGECLRCDSNDSIIYKTDRIHEKIRSFTINYVINNNYLPSLRHIIISRTFGGRCLAHPNLINQNAAIASDFFL